VALAEEVVALRDRAVAELTAAHDYYTDTTIAWRIVLDAIRAGLTFTNQNTITTTVTTEAELATNSREYVTENLAHATFQQFISIFENFFFDFLRLWLMAYPQSLAERTLRMRSVLDAPDTSAVVLDVVNRELNEITYQRPKEWFAFLESRASLGCPTTAEIEWISEAKASRDVLAHNRGVVNNTYLSKSGAAARFQIGDRIEISESYHRETWELLRKVVNDLSQAVVAKMK
jgi:hypothetical protein